MARADQISRLQNDLHINHFHEIGAGALAEKLYDSGYRLIPEPSQDKVQKIKDICRSMITASHYNNLEDDMFESYIKEIRQLFTILELTLLTPEEIHNIVVTESLKEGFDNDKGYIRVRSEDYVKAGSLAQISKNKKELGQ